VKETFELGIRASGLLGGTEVGTEDDRLRVCVSRTNLGNQEEPSQQRARLEL
jgi:hypothetical protein